MTRTSFVAVGLLLTAASGAHAQEARPQSAPPAQAPAAPGAAGPGMSRERMQRIYLIRQYETVLTNAVRTGANSLAAALKLADPTSLFVTGSARARGFELEGYGVVFDVDVPTMMQSVLWSAQTLQRQQEELDRLNEILADPRTTDAMRRVAQLELRNMQRRAVAGPQTPPAMPTMPVGPAQGMAVAQSTDVPAGVVTRAGAAESPAPDPRSPDEMYTDVIKNVLIDTMLSFGPVLRLGDDEWLTVAARASTPGVPNQLDDSSSILIRIKGSDLSAFMSKKITREEVLKKIEIKEG